MARDHCAAPCGLDIYKVVASHHLAWPAVFGDVLLVAFLVLYVRRSRLAWVVILTFGIIGLVESPFVFFYLAPRYPLRVRLLSFCFAFGFSLVILAYGFVVRRRYELYLHDRGDAAQNI